MHRVDSNRFQVRKHLRDFKDGPNWEFKFLINGTYWAAPDVDPRKKSILDLYDLKSPNAPHPTVSDTGNVRFYLKGFTDAKQVILAGSFNNWDESAVRMKRSGDGWEIHLSLAPGIYEYKFIADGQWMEDPANPEKRRNEYYGYNSVVRVFIVVHFRLDGYLNARQVVLAGSFNNWDPSAIKMRRTDTGWRAELPLVGGKHQYKFVVDGAWMTDPANRRVEIDREGNHNSVLFVN
jgi:1,4-alpha-glucan branching enzyme